MFNTMPKSIGGSGSVDISGLIGKTIVSYGSVVDVETFITSVVGINTIEIPSINGTAGMQIKGYVGTVGTVLLGFYQTGTKQIDVSAYERISFESGSSGGCSYGNITVID